MSIMGALNIMVVDDSALTIKKLTAMLAEMGHQVIHTCRTGQSAQLEYGQFNPDLVTMDITMPDMNGIEATRHIIETYPDALIVMVTSHGQEQMVLEAIEAGAKGYILKPIDKTKLEDTITKIASKYKK